MALEAGKAELAGELASIARDICEQLNVDYDFLDAQASIDYAEREHQREQARRRRGKN